MEGLTERIKEYENTLTNQVLNKVSVNDMWLGFKSMLTKAISEFIPSKLSKENEDYPWIPDSLKCLIRKRDRLYNKWQKTHSPALKEKVNDLKHRVQREMRQNYWEYLSNMFTEDDSNNKKFWSYIKKLRKDSQGVGSLKQQGNIVTETKEKAKLLNEQFQSAFTKEEPGPLPDKGPSPHPTMPDMHNSNNPRCQKDPK